MIFDSHAHMDDSGSRQRYDPPEKIIAIMDAAGIDMAVVSSYRNASGDDPRILEYVAEGAAGYPDRLIPYVRLSPWSGRYALETLDRAVKEFRFRGVKLNPAGYDLHPSGDITVEIFRKAAEYDVPVLVHCADEAMCLPLQYEAAVEQSPETRVILAHMGGAFHFQDALRVCQRHRNVYMDTSAMPFVEHVRRAVRELGPGRVLFGTGIPMGNALLEIEKVRHANLGKQAEERVFFRNIMGILRIKREEEAVDHGN
ncbi:amidohydrolase family protein [Papillibacter cinnamivorans]|uniref:Amidohydrolase-related domain-containing protein n=1 Tax=Papillibacter cinnamivorans DSM 12816 TaxID=1122930 RepID=A0A1W2CUF0_9FIRM|nr:amidohydrolase family protein [Papillibacter cinnamivorans]SMC88843.1 hypothetical protein SAMN02745168_0231 [Papillibacter cinnamivorans DSM 12816]